MNALALTLTLAAPAQCPPAAPYAHHARVVKEVVVRREVVVPVIAPVAVYAPVAAYSAVYVPPAAPAAAPAPAAASALGEMQQVLQAIQGVDRKVSDLDQRLRAVEGRPGPAAPAAKPPEAGPERPDPFAPKPAPAANSVPSPAAAMLALAQAKCASCHGAQSAAEKGGGFALLDVGGQLAKLDDRQARKVQTLTHLGRMPPKSSGIQPVTDEEVGAIVAWIDSLK